MRKRRVVAGLFWVGGMLMSGWSFASGPAWVLPAVQAPHVRRYTFISAAAGTTVSYQLYTPAAYNEDPQRRFPVVYWLHGTGGGQAGIAPLSTLFDRAIQEGKMPPVLVVFPNGLATSMWCDSKDGSVPMETMVVKELVPHIDATFRTVGTREGRLIEGFSMGGYGAARLGFKYPDVFGAVSIFAGGPLDRMFQGPRATQNSAEREHIFRTTYGGDLTYFQTQSPLTLAEKNAQRLRVGVRIRQVVGALDPTAELNRGLSDLLTTLSVPHEFIVVPDVGHQPIPLLRGLGEDNWRFYRAVFGSSSPSNRPRP